MVPPLPLLQGIAHLEREKHKILDDDDREQASVNLLKNYNIKSISVVIRN